MLGESFEMYEKQGLEASSSQSYTLQAIALLGTILAYVAPPIIINWAKTVGHNDVGKPVKVDTFLSVTVIFFAKLVTVLISLCFGFFWDCKAGDRGFHYLKSMVSWRGIVPWLPIGGLYAIADVAEVMANGRVDAATYTILSQSRLVGTALAARAMLGSQRSGFQWSILSNLTIVIIGWELTPNDFGAPPATIQPSKDFLGYGLCFVKQLLSIVCGIMMQTRLHADTPLLVQQAQSCIASVFFCLILVPVLVFCIYPAMGTPWVDERGEFIGFFGGRPVPLSLSTAGEATGWSGKTIVVLGMYISREFICNYCVKKFDALIKNLCNAISLVVTYVLAVWWLGDVAFNGVKALFAVVICMEIVHYGLADNVKTKQ